MFGYLYMHMYKRAFLCVFFWYPTSYMYQFLFGAWRNDEDEDEDEVVDDGVRRSRLVYHQRLIHNVYRGRGRGGVLYTHSLVGSQICTLTIQFFLGEVLNSLLNFI